MGDYAIGRRYTRGAMNSTDPFGRVESADLAH